MNSDPPVERQLRPSRSEVRDRLLDAARREFAARGFDGVSLEQVAAAAGFSKGAIYSNFASKNELILAVLEKMAMVRLDAARAERLEPGQILGRRLGDHLITTFAGDLELQLLNGEFWLRAIRDPELRESFVQYRRRLRRMVADEFERLVPGGDAELSSMEIATAMLGLFNGIGMERSLDPEAASSALLGITFERLFNPPSP